MLNSSLLEWVTSFLIVLMLGLMTYQAREQLEVKRDRARLAFTLTLMVFFSRFIYLRTVSEGAHKALQDPSNLFFTQWLSSSSTLTGLAVALVVSYFFLARHYERAHAQAALSQPILEFCLANGLEADDLRELVEFYAQHTEIITTPEGEELVEFTSCNCPAST